MHISFKAAWQWLHSGIGRGLTGAGALATLAWFLWPESDWHVHADALSAFVLAMLAWLASLPEPKAIKASPHDIELFARFRSLLREEEKSFLRNHDLGGSFSWEKLDGVMELANSWRGAEFEFDDQSIQEKFAPMLDTARAFISALALGSWIIDTAGKWATTVPDRDPDAPLSEKTNAKIKQLNNQATTLIEDIDSFIKYTRSKLTT